jgi:PEP-CTERM motif
VSKILLNVVAAAATILAASAASATTALIDGITVIDHGRVNPETAPNLVQPGVKSGTAQIQTGQVTGPGNPPEFSNPGWNPFGLSDTSHQWWNVEGGTVTISGASNILTIVWGSPNDDNPDATNTVSFFSGTDETGKIGQVLASDLYSAFGVDNTQEPGYLVSFLVPKGFGSVEFTTGSSDFEFAVTAVPEPSTWAMLGMGFAGLALAGYKRSRDRLAPAFG